MNKRIMFVLVAFFGIVIFNVGKVDAAVQLDPNGNGNIITHFAGIPSSMTNKAYTQYRFNNGSGYTDVKMVTTFERKTGTSPVTIKNINVTYFSTGPTNPYKANFFIDKRDGTKAFDVLSKIPKNERVMSKRSGVYNIPLNITNAQSVNLNVQRDLAAAAADQGTRFQYITVFY